MHIRKWLRILINRSLVLGTIDRPSVHDLVLDFAVAQHSSTEIATSQFHVVEAFREARPMDAYGRRKYDVTLTLDSQNAYVCTNAMHHVSTAMQQDDLTTEHWLQDLPQDELTVVVAQKLGMDNVQVLATRAEERHDWRLAALYWSIVREVSYGISGSADDTVEAALRSQAAIARMSDSPAAAGATADPVEAIEDLQFAQASTIVSSFNIPVIIENMAAYEGLMSSGAGVRDPARVAQFRWLFLLLYPVLEDWSDDMVRDSAALVELCASTRASARLDPDPNTR
jgi:hypothetical protein